jgi:glutathione synthase/RimK-type ligase-like ATP-grasp enzyme
VILILTNEDDVTTDFVVQELRQGEFLRINGETLGHHAQLAYEYDGRVVSGEIRCRGRSVGLGDVSAVYCRRLGMPVADAQIVDEGLRDHARAEQRALLEALPGLLSVRWMNHPHAVARAESKPLQLALAQQAGLFVPKTIITNDASRAARFAAELDTPVILKALSRPRLMMSGSEHILFTSRVLERTADAFEGMHLAPCIVQEEVRKRMDLRVTVVGERVFAAEIDSQAVPEAVVDWRAAPALDHAEHTLPPEVSVACVRLCRALNLQFGALDFALDVQGRYMFFEINPNGQWAWLQLRAGLPLARAIAEFLRGAP